MYKSQAIIPNIAGKTVLYIFCVFFPIQIHVSSWIKQNGSGSNRSGDLKYRSNARMKYFSAPGTCIKGCHLRWTKIGLQKFKPTCGIVQLIVRDIRTNCECVNHPSQQTANPVNSQKHGNSSKHVFFYPKGTSNAFASSVARKKKTPVRVPWHLLTIIEVLAQE